MPKFIVKGHTDKPQVFFLRTGTVRIGRGDHCELRLPNVSVSREHCRVHVLGANAHLEDLGSQNGLLLDGEPVDQAPLKSGSELSVGRYRLIFLGDSREDRFYNGHFVGYLQVYDPGATQRAGSLEDTDQAATFALSPEALRKMAEGGHLVDSARVVAADNDTRFWRPGDKRLSFGGSAAMVRTRGWFSWGVVAEISYSGGRHVLHNKSLLVSCAVGTEQVSESRPLRHGDRVRIGSSLFIYDAPPLRKKGREKGAPSAADLLRPMSLEDGGRRRPAPSGGRAPVHRPPALPPAPARPAPQGSAPVVPPPVSQEDEG